MADGPMSTPRRPAPRSSGAPMMAAFMRLSYTTARPARERRLHRDARELGERRQPGEDLLQALGAQRAHAGPRGRLGDRVARRARHGEPADLVGDRHDLVEADAALVAGAAAASAAGRLARRDGGAFDRIAVRPHDLAVHDDGLLAVAQPASEALGEHAAHGARDEERLDAHLDEARDG